MPRYDADAAFSRGAYFGRGIVDRLKELGLEGSYTMRNDPLSGDLIVSGPSAEVRVPAWADPELVSPASLVDEQVLPMLLEHAF